MLPFITQPALAPAYQVAGSLLFRGAQYLSRTPAAQGSRKTWTFSAWVRRAALGSRQAIFGAGSGTLDDGIGFESDDKLKIWLCGASRTWVSAPVFRDTSAWLHVVLILDTSNPAEADRVRLYVNGGRITAFDSSPLITQDDASTYVGGTTAHGIGRWGAVSSGYLSGELAEVAFVDSQALPPSIFGETDPVTGTWRPKKLTGITWGSSDFYLGNPWNAVSLGTDYSGWANTWMPNGFAASDVVLDSPTNVYATLNALYKHQIWPATYSNGNLTASGVYAVCRSPLAVPPVGKWYWEQQPSAIGATVMYAGISGCSYLSNGQKVVDGVQSDFVATSWAANDVIGIAVDSDASRVSFFKSGTLVGFLSYSLTDTQHFPVCTGGGNEGTNTVMFNFGQRAFTHTPPAGFKALCTANLPVPPIKKMAEGLVQLVSSGSAIIDELTAKTTRWGDNWVEIVKRRDAAEDWRVRFSDDPANGWAFNSTAAKASAPSLAAGASYVGYRLRVGKKYGVWTAEVVHATGTATTVTHGLATARNAVMATRISTGGGDRYFYHPDLAAGTLVKLNDAGMAVADTSIAAVGEDSFQLAASLPSGTYRVLVFAVREGFLNLTAVTGNGNVDGTFIPLDVSPAFVLVRASNGSSNNAVLLDQVRSPSNPVFARLHLNKSDAESSSLLLDMVVGGLKFRTASTTTAVILAIGRPVGGVGVTPATAR